MGVATPINQLETNMATKKKTAKKAVKKATKRVTKRGRKTESKVPNIGSTFDQQETAAPIREEVMGDASELIDRLLRDEKAAQGESFIDKLRQIEIIDLSQSTFLDKMLILSMLKAEGYVTSTLKDLTEDWPTLVVGLNCTALRLQHNNKLVYVGDIDNDRENTNTSRPVVFPTFSIGLGEPGPIIPDEIYQNGASYVRVG